MQLILDFAKELMLSHLKEDGIYVDFTMGNGHDTLFLAQQHPKGMVYAFDIQEQALSHTKALLAEHGITSGVTLILDSHEQFPHYITAPIDIGIFNLGYLPGADKTVTTQTQTTLQALEAALAALSETGILILVLYPGHPEGKRESEAVEAFCRALSGSNYNVIKYDFINKQNPPYLLAVEKRIRKH